MTKEAAEELEEMGEDTSDMIMSQSKMREMIMNATKVASNNFKGVDIQTELGNYKSTFQILSEIGAIWDEIKQADLRTGDNRQNLLLEAMAGKNRANTLASVLMNNDILQSAYQDSKYNAAGKATEELEKVSQSITFHLNQLTNAWQELWANAANRDIINMFIDLGTTILNLINDVGGLQSAFTLLWGGAIVKGLATADSWLVKFVRGLDAAKASSQGLGNTLSNIFTNLTGSTGDTTKETRWKGLAQIQKGREQQVPQQIQQQPPVITPQTNPAVVVSKQAEAEATQNATVANLENASSFEVLQIAQQGSVTTTTENTVAKTEGAAASQKVAQGNAQEAESAELATKALQEKTMAEIEAAEAAAVNEAATMSPKSLAKFSAQYDKELSKAFSEAGQDTMDWSMAYMDNTTAKINSNFDAIEKGAAGVGATLASWAVNPMTWLVAIPAIIGAITTGMSMWSKYQQDLVDKAKEATNTWNDTQTNLDNYTQKYQDLHTQLENVNLTEEEQIDIKKQIYDLQKQITDEYGHAADGINLVNGNLDDQLAKLRQIRQEQAHDNLRDNRKAYDSAIKEMEKTRTYEMIAGTRNATEEFNNIINGLGENFSVFSEDMGEGLTNYEIKFTGDASQAEKELQDLYDKLDAMGEEGREANSLQTFFYSVERAIKENDKILTKHKDNYESYLEQAIYADTKQYGDNDQFAGDILVNMEEAVNNHNAALREGDPSKIKETEKAFKDVQKAAEDFYGTTGNERLAKPFKELEDSVDKVAEEAYNVKKKFDDPKTKNIVESVLGSPKENKKTAEDIPDSLREAAENILDEQRKAYDWGMKPLGINPLQGLYGETQFGNINMDKRPIIKWNEEYRKKFAEALESWNYTPEDGMIDTVFGGSDNFNGLEIAFTPILATEDGKLKDFMSYDAVHEYIQGLVEDATDKDGKIDAQLVLDLDADRKNIIGAIDGIGKYSAATVGKMMHFSGTKGSIYLGMEQLSQAAKEAGVDVNKVMEILRNTGNVDALAGVFDDFKYDLADIEGQLSDLPNASDDILTLADAFGVTSDSSQEYINAVAELLGRLGYIATNSMDEAGESFDKFTQKASGWIEETSNLSSTLSKGQGFLTFTKTQDEQGHDIASEVKALADAYKDLPGYNYASLFEETAGGIMVNAEALRALQAEEESMRHAKFYEKRQELMEKFTASSGMAAEAYRKQIEELDMLWSAYSGATSALSKYQNGHGAADYSTNYKLFRDQIFKEGDAYLESGEIGEEGFRRVAQLFSYKDLALASVDEVVEAYQKGADTMQRFFTEDPTEGANLWIDEIMSWPEEYAEISTNAAGETVMTMTDKNLDAVAEHYGVSKDLILSLMNELNATGSRVHFFTDGQMQQLDAVTEKAEAARQRLLEIRDQGTDPALANSDILNFDINSLSADELKAKIEELQTLRANPDIDSESASVLDELLQLAIDRMDLLNGKTVEPEIEMDTDGLNQAGEVATDLNERLDQINQYRKLNYDISISGDDKVKEVSTQIASWPRAMQEAYGFEFTTNADEIAKQIEDKFPNGIQLQVNPEVGGEDSLEPNPSVADYDLTVGADTTQAEADIAALKNDPNLSEFEMHVGTDSPQAQQDIENTTNGNYTAQISTEVEPISESTTKSALSTLGDGIKTTVEAGLTKDAELESLTNGQELRGQGVVDIRVGENEAADEQAKLEQGTESPVHYEPQTEELDAAKAEAEEPIETPMTLKATNTAQQAADQAGASQGVTTTSTENKVTNEETHTTATTDTAQLDVLNQKMQSVQAMSGSSISIGITVSGVEDIERAEVSIGDLAARAKAKISVTIGGNAAPFNKTIVSANTLLTALANKKTEPKITANNSNLKSKVDDSKSKLNSINDKKVRITASQSGFSTISSWKHSIYDNLHDKEIKVHTTYSYSGDPKMGKGGFQGSAHNQGTIISKGRAYAGGTLSGNWGLPRAEKGALVNELGSEVIVTPDGHWQILNDGDPTFTNLPKGTIIFNHKQSESLLKQGYINGSHGKIVGGAFARGTVDEDEDMNEEDLDELTGNAFVLGTTGWDGRLSGESHAVGGTLKRASKRSRGGSSSSNSSKSSGKSSGKSSKSNKSGKSGKSNKSSKSSSSSKAKDFLETLDSIEIQINRIDALFQKLDTDIGKTYAAFASRASNATSEISKLGDEIKRIDASLNSKSSKTNYLYKAAEAAKAAGLNSGDEGYTKTGAKGTALSQGWITWIQNSVNTGKYMTIDDVKDEGLWKKIQAYQTWYEKYVKLQQKRQDYVNKMSQLTIQQLQLIQTEWEAVLNNLNAYITENQNRVDLQTEQGYDASVRYYNNQINYNKTRLTDLNKEATALQAKLNEAVSAGYITKYSEEWYKWQTQIKNIQNEVINTTKEIVRLNNEIRQLKWDRFDRAQDKLSDLAEEMEFLNGLIYENDKFTEEGNITNRGRAAMGLIAMQYDEYVKQAKRYQKEVAALNKELANDPYNNKLIEQRNTWLKAQQDAIENARQQKEAMADLIEDGIKKQIDYMDELIDKYEDALDAEKAQNKYAEEMAEKQKKVNSIQKQLRALEGDDSEEGQTRRQKLRDDLKEAQKDLKDAQEDQRLSDISDALSEMQEKYEDVLNARLDNIDKLFAESVTAVNQNGASIVSEIQAIGKSVDYNFSELLNGIVTDKSTQDKASDTSSKALVSGTNDTTGLLTNTSAAAVKDRDTGWKKSGNDWYYADEYGNAKTGWVKDKNKWYYLDDNGKMTKGWQQVNGKWYHMDGSGAMQSGWQKINNKWYYLNDENDGSMATGWKKVKDKWYYMDSNGAMQTGWQQVNNKWYYLDGSGAMKTGWQKSNNKWYYLDKKTGAMTTGWQKDQNKWYYMDQTGKMTTGWQQVNNKWYYMDGSGAMQTGWKKSNNKWYYLKDDGSMATGWQKVSNKWYYMDNSGAMTTGWQKVNNKWYYMNSSGQMLTGEQKIGQNTYYLGQDGAMRTGKFVVNGITYITDSSGKIKSKVKGKYAKGTASVKQTGLYQVDEQGEEVFINKQGKIYTRLEKGSTVLPHDAAVNLLKGMTNPAEFIANHMDMRPNKNITTTNNTSGNVTNYITFNMDGVTNYQEFMREAQRDPNFTKYIQEISIGKLNGNNSLKGNSIRFR